MTSRIHNITVDCARPYQLAEFWSAVLGRPVHPDNEPQDDEVGVPLDNGGELLFQRVPEGKLVKNRVHLCLRPEQLAEDEVSRLSNLGAQMSDDRRIRTARAGRCSTIRRATSSACCAATRRWPRAEPGP